MTQSAATNLVPYEFLKKNIYSSMTVGMQANGYQEAFFSLRSPRKEGPTLRPGLCSWQENML